MTKNSSKSMKQNKSDSQASTNSKPANQRQPSVHSEDEFDDFESEESRGLEAPLDNRSYVTIWMNNWIDEDDGDFAKQYQDELNKF